MHGPPRSLVVRAVEAIKCRDDALSPEPDDLLCSEPDLHEDDHIARGDKGKVLRRWARGMGRSVGELRAHFDIPPYK